MYMFYEPDQKNIYPRIETSLEGRPHHIPKKGSTKRETSKQIYFTFICAYATSIMYSQSNTTFGDKIIKVIFLTNKYKYNIQG